MADTNGGRIGILGGTFDPIHLGHVSLGEAAIAAGSLEKLMVIPTKLQPFKLDKKITDGSHRLAMTRLAFEGQTAVEVSDYELSHEGISYTYDTLAGLSLLYPSTSLFFITGTDAFLYMDQWYKGEDILKGFSFLVAARPGYKSEELAKKIDQYQSLYGCEIILIRDRMPDISSTQIKENLQKGLSVSQFLPPMVERYIYDKGLYR